MNTLEEIKSQVNLFEEKIKKGGYLNYDEETLRFQLITNFFPNQYQLNKDMVFVQSFNLLDMPSPIIEEKLTKNNINPLDILNEYLAEFEKDFNTNHADHFYKEFYKDCNSEINEAKKKYIGTDLDDRIVKTKLKFIFLKIRAERAYKDFLINNNCTEIKYELADEQVYIDKSTLIHVMNRHMIRNHTLRIDYQKGKTLLFENPKTVIPKIERVINLLNSYFKSEGKKLNNNNNNFYYKHDLLSEPHALHINYGPINIKGSKAKMMYRVDSFYPMENEDKLIKYKIGRIRNDFYLYE